MDGCVVRRVFEAQSCCMKHDAGKVIHGGVDLLCMGCSVDKIPGDGMANACEMNTYLVFSSGFNQAGHTGKLFGDLLHRDVSGRILMCDGLPHGATGKRGFPKNDCGVFFFDLAVLELADQTLGGRLAV